MSVRKKPVRRGAANSSSEQGHNRSKRGRGPSKKKGKPRGRAFPKGQSGNPAAQFAPGESGNPGGRPALPAEYKAAMDALEPRALNALATILDDPAHPRFEQTAEYVLNRTKGRPRQAIELSGPDGKPVQIEGDDPVTTLLRAMIAKREEDDGGDEGQPA